MLLIKRILQLDNEISVKQVSVGLGYDVPSDQVTAEFGFSVDNIGFINGLIKLSSIRQDKSSAKENRNI